MFGLDLVVLHAPSLWVFREELIVQGPLADVIPSTTEFEMYPIGLTSLASHLDAKNYYHTRLVNLAYQAPAEHCNGRHRKPRRRGRTEMENHYQHPCRPSPA